MNQTDYSLLSKMNIQSDAIIVNQCNRNETTEFNYNHHHILWISLKERGVGLSRNTALLRSSADIVLFADEDVVYSDEYEQTIIQAFESHPKISLIAFNLSSLNEKRPEYLVKKDHKLTLLNCLKYGACRIAVKRESVFYRTITFSLLFGGGSLYSAGEDNLFVVQCLRHGLKGMASREFIGLVEQKSSTWFKGYTEKYYYDRGILMYLMYGDFAYILLTILNHRNRSNELLSLYERQKASMKGIQFARVLFR